MLDLVKAINISIKKIHEKIKSLESLLGHFEKEITPESLKDLKPRDKLEMYKVLSSYHIECLKTVQAISENQVDLTNEEYMLIYFFRNMTPASQKELISKFEEFFNYGI